jgi:hypothetical protein
MISHLFSLTVRALVVAAVLPPPSALGAAFAPGTAQPGTAAVATFSVSNAPAAPGASIRADAILPPAADPASR